MKLLRLSGLIGAIALWVAIFSAGALTPGYSHLRSAISALGMEGAPAGWMVDWFGLPLMALGFVATGYAAVRDLRRGPVAWAGGMLLALAGVGALLVGLSPCSANMDHGFCNVADSAANVRHVVGTLLAFWLTPLAALVLGFRVLRSGPDRVLYGFSIGMAAAMLTAHGLLMTAVFDPQHLWFGLWQRLIVLTITAWVGGVSVYLARRGQEQPFRMADLPQPGTTELR